MNLFALHSLTSVPVRERKRERDMERDKIVRAFFKLKWVRTHKKKYGTDKTRETKNIRRSNVAGIVGSNEHIYMRRHKQSWQSLTSQEAIRLPSVPYTSGILISGIQPLLVTSKRDCQLC